MKTVICFEVVLLIADISHYHWGPPSAYHCLVEWRHEDFTLQCVHKVNVGTWGCGCGWDPVLLDMWFCIAKRRWTIVTWLWVQSLFGGAILCSITLVSTSFLNSGCSGAWTCGLIEVMFVVRLSNYSTCFYSLFLWDWAQTVAASLWLFETTRTF